MSRFGNYLRNNCLAQANSVDLSVIELATKAIARLTQVVNCCLPVAYLLFGSFLFLLSITPSLDCFVLPLLISLFPLPITFLLVVLSYLCQLPTHLVVLSYLWPSPFFSFILSNLWPLTFLFSCLPLLLTPYMIDLFVQGILSKKKWYPHNK